MRLSATERIIREAESQDASGASADDREAAARCCSNVGFNFAATDDADQEGVTLVDRDRVALALQQLRALGLTPSRVPDDGPAHESPPQPPSVGPIAPTRVSDPFRPGAPGGPNPEATGARAEGYAGTSGQLAPLDADQPRLDGSRERKGQPSGILIAGVAILVVALGAGAGAWSTRSGALVTSPFGRDANSRGVLSADRPQATLGGSISPVVVHPLLAAEAPPGTEAAIHDPAPSSSPSPSTPPRVGSSATPPRNQASATRTRPRTMQRQAPNHANRRKAAVAKVVAARLRSSHAAAPANPPEIRAPEARHPSADPDATLPISE